MWDEAKIKFIFLVSKYWYQIDPAPCIEKTILFPLNWDGTRVINQVCGSVSVLSICLFIYPWTSSMLCQLVQLYWVLIPGSVNPSILFVFKIVLVICSPLHFLIHFRSGLLIPTHKKKFPGVWLWLYKKYISIWGELTIKQCWVFQSINMAYSSIHLGLLCDFLCRGLAHLSLDLLLDILCSLMLCRVSFFKFHFLIVGIERYNQFCKTLYWSIICTRKKCSKCYSFMKFYKLITSSIQPNFVYWLHFQQLCDIIYFIFYP